MMLNIDAAISSFKNLVAIQSRITTESTAEAVDLQSEHLGRTSGVKDDFHKNPGLLGAT